MGKGIITAQTTQIFTDEVLSGAVSVNLLGVHLPEIKEGTRAYVWTGGDVCGISGYVVCGKQHNLEIDDIWKQYKKRLTGTKADLKRHYRGLKAGTVMELSGPMTFVHPVPMQYLVNEFDLDTRNGPTAEVNKVVTDFLETIPAYGLAGRMLL